MQKYIFTVILALLVSALLLSGCTMNPQDTALPGAQQGSGGGTSTPGAGSGTGSGSIGAPGSGAGPAGGSGTGTSVGSGSGATAPGITLTTFEVAKHNSASDCWMVINGVVLDLTSFTIHPGGSEYTPYCGGDGTAAYESTPHSSRADSWFANYKVGMLGETIPGSGGSSIPSNQTGNASAGEPPPSSPPATPLSSSNDTTSPPPPPPQNQSAQTTLTASEIAKHNSASDCWMIINGVVLDLTSFISHPGGSAYLPYCGKDGTSAYEGTPHSATADSWFRYYQVGLLGQAITPPPANATRPIPPPGHYEDDDDD